MSLMKIVIELFKILNTNYSYQAKLLNFLSHSDNIVIVERKFN